MTTKSEVVSPASSLEVRSRLVDALRLDLVGPWAGHPLADERLFGWTYPSNWYLTGFLIPAATPPEKAADDDQEDDAEVAEQEGVPGESVEDRKPAKKAYFPSSIGLSFLVAADAQSLSVTVQWGDYVQTTIPREKEDKPLAVWQRKQRVEAVAVPLAGKPGKREYPVPGSDGLVLHVVERSVPAEDMGDRLPAGTRSMSVFLVNQRVPDKEVTDRACVFQVELAIHGDVPFVPRPDLRGSSRDDWDELLADLHYADAPELATGHGVSADWTLVDGACLDLRTTWLPRAEVEKTQTAAIDGVVLEMERLGALADGQAVEAALRPLVARYRAWIATSRTDLGRLPKDRRETAEALLGSAEAAAARIERGIGLLASDSAALDAFRVANRAVAAALVKRLKLDAPPAWRAFQIAFILLNLPGVADPKDRDREIVDLLFFPTGGGKTEAYLGLAAFAMVYRRFCNPGAEGRVGAGVSVMMRYTLRLLTLDQLGRAAGLVCALELERERDVARYGAWPFEIGLWVGKAATPNLLGKKGDKRSDTARTKVKQFKEDPKSRPSPIPLETCPWCGTKFTPLSFALLPNDDKPTELKISCASIDCDFSGKRTLPIQAVDEPIYRRLPAFLIATVDKFASLPWVAQSGALLGGANRFDVEGFYGGADPEKGRPLPAPLPPPDLIIQDELHLISGPLGTMAGLYETAVEALSLRFLDGHPVKPKIVASTATVRRASDQIQALFGRPVTQVFPPPGPSRRDSFFAETVPPEKSAARLYLGVAAQGRNPKVLMRKVWLALMGAAQRAYMEAGGYRNQKNPADPYMTVLGYFNALRELGGARRILEEEVQSTVASYGSRRRVDESPGLFMDRTKVSEVMELTSRVPTDKVAEARRRLERTFADDPKDRVDCAIATNMISVGLDVQRLGLMVVLGQPKTHAEYIQATSRVGRDVARPGLVVTLLNIHKPRDRSHYERFRYYHETFYRSVEAGSVTPFSARALDRGFSGAMVALARHVLPELTPPEGVEQIAAVRVRLEERLVQLFRDRVNGQPLDEEERQERLLGVQRRVVDLLDAWTSVFEGYRKDGVPMQYQRYESDLRKPLLREMLDRDFETEQHRKFRANRSLRDVEPEVNLFLKDLTGQDVKEGA